MAVYSTGTTGSSVRDEAIGPGARSPVPALLWVPDDDVRLLLRGLLALEHHPVALDAADSGALRRWSPGSVALLVIDAVSGADRWREELSEALRSRPELRAVVLLPPDGEDLRAEAEALGARVTLVRPFALREFARAIREALGVSSIPGEV